MFATDVVALAAELAAADPATCDRGDLAELVRTSQRLRGWLDALDVRIALQASRLAEQGGCEAPAAVLAGEGRRSVKDAAAAADRAGVCDLLPGVHDALAGGDVSAGHADALARVARDLDDAGRSQLKELEATVVESATTSTVEAFEREMRDLARILAPDDGVGNHERLRRQRRCAGGWIGTPGCATPICNWTRRPTPSVSAALGAAIAAEQAKGDDTEQRSFDQLKADAMVALVTGARTLDRRVPEVTVLIDVDTLRTGSTITASVRPATANRYRRTRCAACAAKRRSCPWC